MQNLPNGCSQEEGDPACEEVVVEVVDDLADPSRTNMALSSRDELDTGLGGCLLETGQRHGVFAGVLCRGAAACGLQVDLLD